MLSVILIAMMSSCSFLDFDETTEKEKDEVYSYFENMMYLANAVYRSLPSDWGEISGALRESATDNAVYTWESNAVYDIYNDKWSPINTIDDKWSTYYAVIHDANAFLNDYTEESLERLEWDGNYEDNLAKLRMTRHEVRALRALYYFELVKRYHEVPLVTEVVGIDDVNSLKKADFETLMNFIVTECDAAAEELPLDHADFYEETGRMTKGAALAVKARALLYAASPLYIGDNDPAQAWEAAAKAAMDVMNLNVYSLPAITDDPLYNAEGGDIVLTSPQMIFETRQYLTDSPFEKYNLPIGFADGTNSGNTPSQNLVDAFEMKDGTAFDWNDQNDVANIYYDASGNQTRDPRLYLNVICNGMTYMNTVMDTYIGGRFGEPVTGATMTGYYLKKLMNETISLDPTHPIYKNHHYPNYRYAEVLLNYAEAMNEWKGPKYTDDECPISACDALNQVRTAAGMPAVDISDQTAFREKVRNERRVELAFEDHRFWDIRRWKIGDVVENIYGVKIRREGNSYTYTKEIVQTRIWKDKMYWYPISASEGYKNQNLGQNPGW